MPFGAPLLEVLVPPLVELGELNHVAVGVADRGDRHGPHLPWRIEEPHPMRRELLHVNVHVEHLERELHGAHAVALPRKVLRGVDREVEVAEFATIVLEQLPVLLVLERHTDHVAVEGGEAIVVRGRKEHGTEKLYLHEDLPPASIAGTLWRTSLRRLLRRRGTSTVVNRPRWSYQFLC